MNIDPEIRDLDVPWPRNWQFRQPSKRADIRKLEWASARELAEQDVWRSRLESLRKLDLPGDALSRWSGYGVLQLCEDLETAGGKYPPTWKDQEAYLKLFGEEWHYSKGINHRRCAKITDIDLRSIADWFLEVADQKERIKAFVLFAATLKVDLDSAETDEAFTYWRVVSMYEVLAKEFGEPPAPSD